MFFMLVFFGNVLSAVVNLLTGDFVGAAINGTVAAIMWPWAF